MTRPLTIGLTGGIGSGKSAVSQLFAEHGIPIIDTDQIARDVVQPNSSGLKAIQSQLGSEFITELGELNRAKLREAIFADTAQKALLESILHPLIRQQMLKQIQQLTQSAAAAYPFIIVAIPLLVEGINNNQKPDYLDEIWVVDCTEETQLKRACARDKKQAEKIQAIILQQASRQQRLQWADRIIDNEAGLPELKQQVERIMLSFSE